MFSRVVCNKLICCAFESSSLCATGKAWWLPVSTVKSDKTGNVTLSYASDCDINKIMGIRYAWRDSPCNFKKCALYGADNSLPVPPFVYYNRSFQKITSAPNRYVVKLT